MILNGLERKLSGGHGRIVSVTTHTFSMPPQPPEHPLPEHSPLTMSSVFTLPEVQWQPVSTRLRTQRWVVFSASWLLVVLLGVAGAVLARQLWVGVIASLVLLTGWVVGMWIIFRQVRAIGYAERHEDFLVRRGVMFRKLTVVPYGRMQYVDVQAGPVERMLKIATVQLHTAAPGVDASIPGLSAGEASRLRERLASLGEAKLVGL